MRIETILAMLKNLFKSEKGLSEFFGETLSKNKLWNKKKILLSEEMFSQI